MSETQASMSEKVFWNKGLLSAIVLAPLGHLNKQNGWKLMGTGLKRQVR